MTSKLFSGAALNTNRFGFGLRGLMALVAISAMFAAGVGTDSSVKASHGTAHPAVDVVFIVDESVSMGGEQADVEANVGTIAAGLVTTLDPQFALVGYGTTAAGHDPGTNEAPHTHTDFTPSVAAFTTAVAGLVAAGGPIEAGAHATSYAMNNLTFRDGAATCVVVITDEDNDAWGVSNNATNQIAQRDQAKADLAVRDAIWFGIIPGTAGNSERDYGPNAGSLAAHTGGSVFNMSAFRADPVPVLTALSSACRHAVTQGITLLPLNATNPTGTTHTVTSTVLDSDGNAVVGREVTFNVVSGPHAGASGTDTTDANGEASFTYAGTIVGIDTITASFDDDSGATKTSNVAKKEWISISRDCLTDVTWTPVPGSFVTNPTAVPFGPAGTFTFDAKMTNVGTDALSDLVSPVVILSPDNRILNYPESPATVGDTLTLPLIDGYADGVLTPGEMATFTFEIGLDPHAPFSFFVDLTCSARPIAP